MSYFEDAVEPCDPGKMPPFEDAVEPCDPGIEVDGSVVVHGLSSISVAVKPPLPSSRPNLAIDIICALDSTGSMSGPGEAGLKQTMRNFDTLVAKSLKKSYGHDEEGLDNIKSVLKSTSVQFFKFGQTARAALDSHHGFLALDDPELQSTCKAIANDMTFDDHGTNIGCAVEYAASAAKKRLQSMAADDAANGTKRITCFVLITDGAVNEGARCAEDMLTGIDNALSDVSIAPMSVFAVGLGGWTDPNFLTKLCRGGFWSHVSDAYYPQDAFDVAFGTILASVDLYTVNMKIKVERDGVEIQDAEVEFRKYIGLLTKDSCRARKIQMTIPKLAKPGDEIVIKTSFGVDVEATESRIFMADSCEHTLEIHFKTTSNMVAGLHAEADDIDRAIEKLKAKILLGETVQSSTDALIQENSSSSAVRSQLERYSIILENTLSDAAPAGSSICTASMSSYASYAPTPAGYSQPMMPRYSHHEVTSSFSRFNS
ncbi:VWA domain-containing protein [bacterium]|nr:VWA domain-containing protein [bacterium]